MFVGIANTPRPYAWGSTTAIAELFGTEPTGEPQAELWLGSHPGSPSVIVAPAAVGGAATLSEWIAADPAETLGDLAATGRLPFLLKLLAAAHPLSLQAHPTPEQGQAGFARENALGIPLDAPNRNYKDAFPKPELIYALSDTFDALCGFRPLDQTRAIVDELIALDARSADPRPEPIEALAERLRSAPLNAVFDWLVSNGAGVSTLVERVVELAPLAGARFSTEFATVLTLSAEYPGDPGIVISLLANRVTLKRGEALYLPAGNIHAYLDGLGVELMASSDNVLRGGLTPKHIDVPELLSVLDFTPVPVPYLEPTVTADGIEVFRPELVGFELLRVAGAEIAASYPLGGPAIALCTSGSVTITGALGSVALGRGEAAYVTPDEAELTFGGNGELFVATVA